MFVNQSAESETILIEKKRKKLEVDAEKTWRNRARPIELAILGLPPLVVVRAQPAHGGDAREDAGRLADRLRVPLEKQ